MIIGRFVSATLLALVVQTSAVPAIASGDMRAFPINDPVLQMTAWTLTLPASWTADGTMLPGSSCSRATSPVYRAMSPDGGTGVYFLPRTDWAWGAGIHRSNDCLPLSGPVSAKSYLNGLARIRGYEIVRNVPMDAELADFRSGLQGWGDMARVLVHYTVAGRPVEELMTATISCNQSMVMGVGQQGQCSANVKRWFAPAGRLQAMLPTFQALRMTLNQDWMQQWRAVMVERTRRLYEGQTQALLAQGQLAQSQRTKEHQDYMAAMGQSRDNRNDAFVKGQYAKQRHNDDYVDMILDCQRLSSGDTRVSVGSNCPNRQTR